MHFEMGIFAAENVEMLFAIGPESRPLYEAFLEKNSQAFYFSDIKSLASKLKESLRKDDIVLVKGSNAINLEKLFELI